MCGPHQAATNRHDKGVAFWGIDHKFDFPVTGESGLLLKAEVASVTNVLVLQESYCIGSGSGVERLTDGLAVSGRERD